MMRVKISTGSSPGGHETDRAALKVNLCVRGLEYQVKACGLPFSGFIAKEPLVFLRLDGDESLIVTGAEFLFPINVCSES
jgi:hypothetical protein